MIGSPHTNSTSWPSNGDAAGQQWRTRMPCDAPHFTYTNKRNPSRVLRQASAAQTKLADASCHCRQLCTVSGWRLLWPGRSNRLHTGTKCQVQPARPDPSPDPCFQATGRELWSALRPHHRPARLAEGMPKCHLQFRLPAERRLCGCLEGNVTDYLDRLMSALRSPSFEPQGCA